MPNYRATITEVNDHTMEFFASDRNEAEAIAWEMFENGDGWMINLNLDLEIVED